MFALFLAVVVLVVVDLLAFLILLMVYLLVLLCRHVAAIVFAIGRHFVVDVGFSTLDVGSFVRRHLARCDTVGDTALLIEAATVD